MVAAPWPSAPAATSPMGVRTRAYNGPVGSASAGASTAATRVPSEVSSSDPAWFTSPAMRKPSSVGTIAAAAEPLGSEPLSFFQRTPSSEPHTTAVRAGVMSLSTPTARTRPLGATAMSNTSGDPSRGPNPLLRLDCFHRSDATSTGPADATAALDAPGAAGDGDTDGDWDATGAWSDARASSASVDAPSVARERLGRGPRAMWDPPDRPTDGSRRIRGQDRTRRALGELGRTLDIGRCRRPRGGHDAGSSSRSDGPVGDGELMPGACDQRPELPGVEAIAGPVPMDRHHLPGCDVVHERSAIEGPPDGLEAGRREPQTTIHHLEWHRIHEESVIEHGHHPPPADTAGVHHPQDIVHGTTAHEPHARQHIEDMERMHRQ